MVDIKAIFAATVPAFALPPPSLTTHLIYGSHEEIPPITLGVLWVLEALIRPSCYGSQTTPFGLFSYSAHHTSCTSCVAPVAIALLITSHTCMYSHSDVFIRVSLVWGSILIVSPVTLGRSSCVVMSAYILIVSLVTLVTLVTSDYISCRIIATESEQRGATWSKSL